MQSVTKGYYPEEVEVFIKHDGFYKAKAALSSMDLYRVEGNTFHIAPGTPFEQSITAGTDGTLEMGTRTKELPLVQYSSRRNPNEFQAVWNYLHSTCISEITSAAKVTFGPEVEDFLYNPGSSQHKQLHKTARAALSTLGHGYLDEPARLGTGALHKFLDKERVHEAMTIAGSAATIKDLDLIGRNRKVFLQARSQNPNAVIIWFMEQRRTCYYQITEDGGRPTPEEIIKEGKAAFHSATNPAIKEQDEQLWETFSRLNHKAIATQLWMIKQAPKLSEACLQAQAKPSFSAIRTAVKALLHGYNALPEPALYAFLKESETRKHKRGKTQRQLCAQCAAIANPQAQQDLDENQTHSILAASNRFHQQFDEDSTPTWDQVLTAYPAFLQEMGKTRPRRAARTRKNTPTKRLTRDQLDSILSGPAHEIVHDALSNSLKVDVLPGHTVTMRTWDKTVPVLQATKQPDGTIEFAATSYSIRGNMPDPNSPNHQESNWTTRGLKDMAAAHKVVSYLEAHWDMLTPNAETAPPSPERVANALDDVATKKQALLRGHKRPEPVQDAPGRPQKHGGPRGL